MSIGKIKKVKKFKKKPSLTKRGWSYILICARCLMIPRGYYIIQLTGFFAVFVEYPRNPLAYKANHFIVYRLHHVGDMFYGDMLAAIFVISEYSHGIADFYVFAVCHVNYGLVHADPADNRHLFPIDDNARRV